MFRRVVLRCVVEAIVLYVSRGRTVLCRRAIVLYVSRGRTMLCRRALVLYVSKGRTVLCRRAIVLYISKGHCAFIFRVKQSKKNLRRLDEFFIFDPYKYS
jgi:hypothetical protein